ncbi:MAG: ATP-dependent DNA helicase RecG, partial [Gammaproteobacteria bacterium]|nr:ATP-dependent DNA helicase RecG [Gammaproteobacteria bacterium]
LLHLPFRYQDRTRFVPLAEASIGDACLVRGEIVKADLAYGGRRSLTATFTDGGGFLTMRLFHFSPHQRDQLRPGLWVRCFGEVRGGPAGREMVHPEYRTSPTEPEPPEPTLTPVYPVTSGLTSPRIRSWIGQALDAGAALGGSVLPDESIPAVDEALRFLHRPPAEADQQAFDAARDRVAKDELLAHILLMQQRQALRARHSAGALPRGRGLGRDLLRNLGFALTGAQRRVVTEVLTDLEREQPMLRLLQGDVGSGKTVVAAFAAIRAAEQGRQTAVMAPTEILAEQHHETFSTWLSPLGIDVALITGRMTAKERQVRRDALAGGETLVAVGTHALIQSTVEFHDLALAIVDEQHRFGVHQRMALRNKGRLPHQLVMTATPIPRTLTMALYADMDVSVIDELPPGRKPVVTRVMPSSRRKDAMARIASACRQGRQAYWVCTLIEESEALDSQAAENVAAELKKELRGLRVGLVHGRLAGAERQTLMASFKDGEIDVLVATTVIEVGVDVPNASLMVIENPERLGLAQLHQLRGRIGRGSAQSHCILLFEPPLTEVARARLAVMRETGDGFVIAEKDLELRGPGDVLGTRQTGEQSFRVADLMRDASLLPGVIALGARLDDRTKATVLATWGTTVEAGYVEV